jgi:Aldehyde:ferredoxin oxidoreductase
MLPILKVHLGARRIERLEIPRAWRENFLGGASLAARLLYPFLTASLDPLSPQAPLLFLTGPLTGTAGPAVGAFCRLWQGRCHRSVGRIELWRLLGARIAFRRL